MYLFSLVYKKIQFFNFGCLSKRIFRTIDLFFYDLYRSKDLSKKIEQLLKKKELKGLERHGVAFVISDFFFYRVKSAVKLCVVNGKQTLIYQRGLPSSNLPQFHDLERLASLAGWQLLEDRRQAPLRVAYDRRRRVYLVSARLFVSGFLFNNVTVFANEFILGKTLRNNNFYSSSISSDMTVASQLGLLFSNQKEINIPNLNDSFKNSSTHKQSDYKNNKSSIAYDMTLKVLEKKWIKSQNDPKYLYEDIKAMAAYISELPKAFGLIMSIKDEPWKIKYRAGDFRSEVKGTRFAVKSVNIFFDSRSAASFKSGSDCIVDMRHCVASPVDSLIHELLHAKLALTKTDEFLSDGGMNGFVYPHRHERKVIALEREIYSAMTLVDNKPRPIRTNHVGYLVQASCSTCTGVKI